MQNEIFAEYYVNNQYESAFLAAMSESDPPTTIPLPPVALAPVNPSQGLGTVDLRIKVPVVAADYVRMATLATLRAYECAVEQQQRAIACGEDLWKPAESRAMTHMFPTEQHDFFDQLRSMPAPNAMEDI